eukprot:m.258103 g.258103  ORF g.258103 m.258103 type:complete len:107 (+) comp28817_c0_seq1:555-875(+)
MMYRFLMILVVLSRQRRLSLLTAKSAAELSPFFPFTAFAKAQSQHSTKFEEPQKKQWEEKGEKKTKKKEGKTKFVVGISITVGKKKTTRDSKDYERRGKRSLTQMR